MPAHQLAEKTAIVTGASRGFGRAIATALVHHGAHVIGVARSQAQLNDLHQQLGDDFEFETGDASDPVLAERLLSIRMPQIVVLNAGATPVTGPLDAQTWETFSTNWHSDVRQVFNFAKASLTTPLPPGSVVITISSGAALRGSPMSGGYAGAKATTRFISAYAQAEANGRSLQVRYVTVLPALTPATELGKVGVATYAERAGLSVKAFEEQLEPILSPEHVAGTIVEIVSDTNRTADAYLLTATELQSLS